MTESKHQLYMTQALALAEKGRFTVAPNPMVACLLVKNNEVVGQGFHQKAGAPHAEVLALEEAQEKAKGATAYVTLEPCCHQGRTPPCTAALIKAQVKEVYVATLDPNPLVWGKGVEALEQAGIVVKQGLLEGEAKKLNEIFFHYIKTKRPFVLVKWAMSLDGRTSTHPQDSRQISSQESQRHTHALRQAVDAILVGSQTAIHDNPQLTARAFTEELIQKQPLRIVLDSKGSLPLNLKLVNGSLPGKTLVATTAASEEGWRKSLETQGTEVVVLPEDELGRVSLPALLACLGKKEISSLLVEGGETIHASFFKEGLVNKIQVYLAPAIISSLIKKQFLSQLNCEALGQDFSFSATL
jgi:diaminohydroxyphosphoribosylaminopyrimidine deaminase/5-amino-6-(5-phosphoribosylamino)uracil reductase